MRFLDRSGMALVMVLGLLFVLAAFGFTVKGLSRQATREVGVLNRHMRCVLVGEAGFAAIMGRLAATPWPLRWFRFGPDIQENLAVDGGTYSYMIADAVSGTETPSEGEDLGLGSGQQADLLIRAKADGAAVSMFWRLIVPENSLDGRVRCVPLLFSYGGENPPLASSSRGALAALVQSVLERRRLNRPRFEELRRPLQAARTPQEIARILGTNPRGPVVDPVWNPGGDPGKPGSARLTESPGGQGPPPIQASPPVAPPDLPPSLPPPGSPPPGPTGNMYPRQAQALISYFASVGIYMSMGYFTAEEITSYTAAMEDMKRQLEQEFQDGPPRPPFSAAEQQLLDRAQALRDEVQSHF